MTDPRNITGLWTGQYWYAEPWEPPTGFVATISDNGGLLAGTTTEPSDVLTGIDERADIRGTREGTDVSFRKYYDGDGAYGHTVIYRGTLSGDGRQVEGQWLLDSISGSFLMVRDLQALAEEEIAKFTEVEIHRVD